MGEHGRDDENQNRRVIGIGERMAERRIQRNEKRKNRGRRTLRDCIEMVVCKIFERNKSINWLFVYEKKKLIFLCI